MSDKEYRQRADLWPLNKQGELINWTIVESKKGLENIRQIALSPDGTKIALFVGGVGLRLLDLATGDVAPPRLTVDGGDRPRTRAVQTAAARS